MTTPEKAPEPQIYRVEVGGASYWMRLDAPTTEEVRAALIDCHEEEVLDEELEASAFTLLDEEAQRAAMIHDDGDGIDRPLYEYARLPAYANTKTLACSEWS